jgi:hypothetical protein
LTWFQDRGVRARRSVCALYALPSLGVAFTVFLRRDVAGG